MKNEHKQIEETAIEAIEIAKKVLNRAEITNFGGPRPYQYNNIAVAYLAPEIMRQLFELRRKP